MLLNLSFFQTSRACRARTARNPGGICCLQWLFPSINRLPWGQTDCHSGRGGGGGGWRAQTVYCHPDGGGGGGRGREQRGGDEEGGGQEPVGEPDLLSFLLLLFPVSVLHGHPARAAPPLVLRQAGQGETPQPQAEAAEHSNSDAPWCKHPSPHAHTSTDPCPCSHTC